MPQVPYIMAWTGEGSAPASANQAAVPTTAPTNTTPFGFTTSAQPAAMIALVNEMRQILINLNFMKGSA